MDRGCLSVASFFVAVNLGRIAFPPGNNGSTKKVGKSVFLSLEHREKVTSTLGSSQLDLGRQKDCSKCQHFSRHQREIFMSVIPIYGNHGKG